MARSRVTRGRAWYVKGIIYLTAETQSASYLLTGAELDAMAGS